MTLSTKGKTNVLATSAKESLLELAEITHQDLAVPIRVVNDTQNLISNGNEFIACGFSLNWPDDVGTQLPQASVSVDNVGRELTVWLEQSNGGRGAKMRIMAALRSSPDVLEADVTLDLGGLSITNQSVDGTLGFKNTLERPAVAVRFDPQTSPGIF